MSLSAGDVLVYDGTNWVNTGYTVGPVLKYPSGFSGNLLELKVGDTTYSYVNSVGTFTLTQIDAVNNDMTYGVTLGHNPSGTPVGGIGTGIQFSLKNTGGFGEAGSIKCVYSDPSSSARSSYLSFNTYYAGTAVEILRLRAFGTTGQGEARFNGDLWHSQSGGKIGFFGVTTAGRQAGAAATAAATYGANEQSMLQTAYNCLRTFGLLF